MPHQSAIYDLMAPGNMAQQKSLPHLVSGKPSLLSQAIVDE
jgi:hypothetical protein